MSTLKVVKVGGKVINDEESLDSFLEDFVSIEGPKVLVHGGGSIASKIGKQLGIEPQMTNGRRITDKETLDVVTMVYGGLVNKKIVAKLQSLGCNATGFTGADLNIIEAVKRKPSPLDFGWVGDIEKVNTDWLLEMLRQEVVPVMAPLTHDGKGNMLNTNADTIASAVATALSEYFDTELMLCFEQEGVMNIKTLISVLNPGLYNKLKESQVITEGMIPKIDVGFEARNNGVNKVTIRSYKAVKKDKSGTELEL